jgi:hypothetical protein
MSSDDSSSRSGLFIYLSTIPRKRFAFVSSAGHAIFQIMPWSAHWRAPIGMPASAGRTIRHGRQLLPHGRKPYFAIAATPPLAVLAP